jgi:hypothetical protein
VRRSGTEAAAKRWKKPLLAWIERFERARLPRIALSGPAERLPAEIVPDCATKRAFALPGSLWQV